MCHTMKQGDGCYAKGMGGCGGNLLQANAGTGTRKGVIELVRYNARTLKSSLTAYRSARRATR